MTRATPEQRAAAARISAGSSSDARLRHAEVRELATKQLQTMMASVLKVQVPVLAKMDMAIFCTVDDVGFITSDRPCIWFDPAPASF
ncbi:hypothetical protein R69927_07837 [Paraburkholderia domus]|nr:hypothetical protein R69749_06378 [Paraburkholderia domus]CAE6944252.1 hypothetical protein R69927_07837 [Paraburkholderia domus]